GYVTHLSYNSLIVSLSPLCLISHNAATSSLCPLSLHDALPILPLRVPDTIAGWTACVVMAGRAGGQFLLIMNQTKACCALSPHSDMHRRPLVSQKNMTAFARCFPMPTQHPSQLCSMGNNI